MNDLIKYYCPKFDMYLDKHEIDDLYSKRKISSDEVLYLTIRKELEEPSIENFVCEYVSDNLEYEFNQKSLNDLSKIFKSWWKIHRPYYYDKTDKKVTINEIVDW